MQNSWPSGTHLPPKAPKFIEHRSAPYHVGDLVKLKNTGKLKRIVLVLACGEAGHSEVRYYLKNDNGHFRYAEDLEAYDGNDQTI